MAITPAGAQVTDVAAKAATNWNKIWKQKIRPKADKRYYTKKKSNQRFQRKGDYALAPEVIRGAYVLRFTATGGGDMAGSAISFGVTLAAAPNAHFIAQGATPPAGCSGTSAAPMAAPGHLCVFESLDNNASSQTIYSPSGSPNGASTFGAYVGASSAAAGDVWSYGSWALGVSTLAEPGDAPRTPSSVGARDGR